MRPTMDLIHSALAPMAMGVSALPLLFLLWVIFTLPEPPSVPVPTEDPKKKKKGKSQPQAKLGFRDCVRHGGSQIASWVALLPESGARLWFLTLAAAGALFVLGSVLSGLGWLLDMFRFGGLGNDINQHWHRVAGYSIVLTRGTEALISEIRLARFGWHLARTWLVLSWIIYLAFVVASMQVTYLRWSVRIGLPFLAIAMILCCALASINSYNTYSLDLKAALYALGEKELGDKLLNKKERNVLQYTPAPTPAPDPTPTPAPPTNSEPVESVVSAEASSQAEESPERIAPSP
jgi:hypothetical protein